MNNPLDKILPKDWKKETGNGLLLAFILFILSTAYDLIKSKTFGDTLSNMWHLLKTPLTLPIYTYLLAALIIYLSIKIRHLYFTNERNSRIGNYTFIQLHKILSNEYPEETTAIMDLNEDEGPKVLFWNSL